ncbi:MAG TPA: FliA/WhiG family RNA polymerase sigma factor [Gemmatimonadaceae bacterium]|nr:FliA/WhiG family RNA polymerase sigma factor [Gemmatimonadaceae bacterium]
MSDADMWQRLAAGDEQGRERLMATHLSLVYHVARGVHRRLGGAVELDELVSAGTLGLAEAIDRFDATRGLAFSTYAVPRIHGAIVDELRRLDHVPSSIRRRARALGATQEQLGHNLGRSPKAQETAVSMGVDVETVTRWQSDAASTTMLRLDDPIPGSGEDGEIRTWGESLAGTDGSEAETRITREQELVHLRAALLELPAVERRVLTLYFLEELKLQDIARVLEVTESRVSQIKQKAMSRLRAALAPMRSVA